MDDFVPLWRGAAQSALPPLAAGNGALNLMGHSTGLVRLWRRWWWQLVEMNLFISHMKMCVCARKCVANQKRQPTTTVSSYCTGWRALPNGEFIRGKQPGQLLTMPTQQWTFESTSQINARNSFSSFVVVVDFNDCSHG
jgi:hypothetical protein